MVGSSANSAPSVGDQLVNGAKVIADLALIPGASQIVEGKVGSGLLFGLAGIAAKTAIGPIGWIAAGLDSYSKSATGKHLWQLISEPKASAPAPATGSPE